MSGPVPACHVLPARGYPLQEASSMPASATARAQ